MDHARRLGPELWHHHDAVVNASTDITDDVTDSDEDGDRVTRVVDGACIFNNPSRSDQPTGCAFHHLAEADGVDHLTYKPEVCWQVPLRVDHHEDDNGHETHLVRQWTLHDWGGEDTDIGWWCDDDERAYSGTIPVAVSLRSEIAAFAGEAVADALIEAVGEQVVEIRPRSNDESQDGQTK